MSIFARLFELPSDVSFFSLERLDYLTSQDKPFFLEIAPSIPHVQGGGFPTIPPARHEFDFPNVTAPRLPNFNPPDQYQKDKPSVVASLPLMNESLISAADASMRARLQNLQGVDEMVEDVISMLEEKGILDNTFGTSLNTRTLDSAINRT